MKIRAYRGPLTVLASGVVGFSLFCIVSAAALSAPSQSTTPIALEPQDLVDSAISNINTVAALTYESISEFIPTSTISPSSTSVPTQTGVPTGTASLIPTRTLIPFTPTRTKDFSGPPAANTPTRVPTRTNTPVPTNTPEPPPTNTTEPPPTNTTEPPPTNTTEPPPTNTTEPPPTNTLGAPATSPSNGTTGDTSQGGTEVAQNLVATQTPASAATAGVNADLP